MTNTLPSPRPARRWILCSSIALAAAAALVGCAGKAIITGKVIQGDVSFMGVVDANDERLAKPGLAGAEVAVVSDPDRPAASSNLGQATSDATGAFSIKVSDQSAYMRPAGFSARKEGYISTTGVMALPPADRRLLVILQPVRSSLPTPRTR